MGTIAPTKGILPRPSREQEPPPPPWFNGRPSGWRVEDRVLRRTIAGSKHLLRCPPAISFDAHAYVRLRPCFDHIEVTDREGGLVYTIAAAEFDRLAERLDRGHGIQLFVRLEEWTVEPLEGHQLALTL